MWRSWFSTTRTRRIPRIRLATFDSFQQSGHVLGLRHRKPQPAILGTMADRFKHEPANRMDVVGLRPRRPCPTLRRLFQQGGLVQLVVERLEADAELVGGFGLVAAVAVEGVVDGLHLQLAERDRRR